MKTCTITLHCTDNSGSTLQAYALQQFLIQNGFENEIINYRPKYLINYGNPFKRILKKIIFSKDVRSQRKKNAAFEKKYLIESKFCFKKYNELINYCDLYDAFLTGSDQIWNMSFKCGNDLAYYLDFVPKNKRTIAYAASIGKINVPKSEINFIAPLVSKIDYVSVREKSSVSLLEKNGVEHVSYVCDPTLLLNKEDYIKIQTQKIEYKYIVVYLVQPSPILDKLVEKVRKTYNCKVILIYGVSNNCYCDLHIRDTSPDEFIGFINNAEFVIASSFHAVMFSHIFEKNFAIVLPKNNQARIEQFLELTHLSSRIIKTESDIETLNLNIDYKKVRPYLEEFKEQSKKFLLNALCKENK